MSLACVLATAAALAGCRSRPTTTVHFPRPAEVGEEPRLPGEVLDYPRATGDVLNPERGFMVDIDLVAGSGIDFDVRERGYTLAYAGVRLDAYRTRPLPASLLAALDRGFERVRDAGFKVVLRFVYNDDARGADATKWQILAHIAQLQPVLAANADVIAVMDAGFIGAWGEWHSSSNGLANQRDRGDILYAVLHALPASRSVTLRSPRYKVDAYGGPITAAQAFDGSDPARVGHHNSCFLASESDLGTYTEPIESWKEMVAFEGRFTPVGGETCQLNPPRTDCATATAELARLRWSFLNALYHRDVLAGWQAQGCYPTIARDLGYRLELRSATFDKETLPGGTLAVAVTLVNTGYAAMYNARPVYLTLDETRVLIDVDPRRWEPGQEVTIHASLRVPVDMAPGPHRLGLWLPDADPRLQLPARVESYAVRFANATWEGSINVLTDALVVAAPRSP